MKQQSVYQVVIAITLAASSSLSLQLAAPDQAIAAKATGAAVPAIDPFKELKMLEQRYFSRAYEHDPPEKRLQRLECLVFGATQMGSNDDRFKKLKAAVAKNDQDAAQAIRERNKSSLSSPEVSKQSNAPAVKKPAGSSSQEYPILNTLEWRALKKTYGKETLDQRLDRLETTLFGQPSTAMSYLDRIERLKKIIGIASPEDGSIETAKKALPMGPMPRAYGRGPYQFRSLPYRVPGDSSSARRGFATPFVTPLPGTGGDDTFDEDLKARMDADFPTIINHMNRHMDEMMKMMMEDMKDVRVPGGSASPYMVPTPVPVPKKEKAKIPPYADPNSI